jgi:hypothetical protein
MKFRTFITTNNSRGNEVSAGNPDGAHIRGWRNGVRVSHCRDGDKDEFRVYMTRGSGGTTGDTYVGSVTEGADSPVWNGTAPDGKLSAIQEHVQEMLEAYRQGMVCGFQFCEGPEVEPETMKTCRACRALHDLLELTK